MAGHGREIQVAGGPARHIPVLLSEVATALEPLSGATIIDGTFGAGGYTRAMLAAGARVIAIDRDPDAIAAGADLAIAFKDRLRLVHGPFSHLDELAGEEVDGVVLDIGVSSMQLDEPERGFSFRADGPLDMRMAKAGPSAADVVNRFKPGDLARIFGFLGEERQAGRIARLIERRRAERPFTRTLDLAETIENHIGRNPKDKIHPATRVFQALRIFVNDELGELARALLAAERTLKQGGRLTVVSFHSLEDRIVKRFIADRSGRQAVSRHVPDAKAQAPTFQKVNGPISPTDAEIAANPRARSAKLRVAVRTGEPPRAPSLDLFDLPALPDVSVSGER
jgi:16S rRNA (cytosine1402-N4)-methyltransferase